MRRDCWGLFVSFFFWSSIIEQRCSLDGSASLSYKFLSCSSDKIQRPWKIRKRHEFEKGKVKGVSYQPLVETHNRAEHTGGLGWEGNTLGMGIHKVSSCEQGASNLYKGWEVRPISSGCYLLCSRDLPSYFFSLVGSSVQIHSVATGQVVSTLMAPNTKAVVNGRSNTFSCAVINPHNPFQLITGSLNGCLMIWDFLDGTLLRTIDVTQPIHLICAHEQFKDYVFVAVSRPPKNAKQGLFESFIS